MPFRAGRGGGGKGATELCIIDPGRELPAGNYDISPLVHRWNEHTRAFTLPTHATCPLATHYINHTVTKIS